MMRVSGPPDAIGRGQLEMAVIWTPLGCWNRAQQT